MIRKIFFWTHLIIGCIAGAVIFIMSVTGVLLAWQRQMIRWADQGHRPPFAVGQTAVSPELLFSKIAALGRGFPSTVTLRSDPAEPASAEFGRAAIVYLNPSTGDVLGEGSSTVRAFFGEVENWHRWLAAGLEQRATCRGLTGASNLLFLGLLLSGAYLWLPKYWNRQSLRHAFWFRRGLSGRARDWNWHNTVRIWCLLPLLIIVSTAVVMSYPWANNLVYRMTGSEAPPPGTGPGRGGPPANVSLAGIDAAWTLAQTKVAGWKSIAIRIPAGANAPVQFLIDSGDGGRPDLRDQLTLKRSTGDIVRWEPFSSNSAGRRLRSWIRFSHTGEAGGIVGETIAAIASLGAAFLVGTGISLAVRRMLRAIARQNTSVPAGTIDD